MPSRLGIGYLHRDIALVAAFPKTRIGLVLLDFEVKSHYVHWAYAAAACDCVLTEDGVTQTSLWADPKMVATDIAKELATKVKAGSISFFTSPLQRT